jgi:PHD/YefM family antitoxin component YafN of YafNO toxin-antitoxin module
MTNLLSFVDRIVPVSRFNRGEAIKIFDELARTGAKIVMKNNAPVSIIMSPKEYERMVDENENLELLLLARDRLEKNVKGSSYSIDDAMRHFEIRESDIEAAEDPELS